MGVFRGVYQGPDGCLWLVSSRLPWQGQGDMYFIQRQAQAMKRLCGPLATQLARALGKPIDYAAPGLPSCESQRGGAGNTKAAGFPSFPKLLFLRQGAHSLP